MAYNLPLKVDEQQVGQRHEDVERKRKYYHIIIFPERTWDLHQERRGQVKNIVMENFNGINQSINKLKVRVTIGQTQ